MSAQHPVTAIYEALERTDQISNKWDCDSSLVSPVETSQCDLVQNDSQFSLSGTGSVTMCWGSDWEVLSREQQLCSQGDRAEIETDKYFLLQCPKYQQVQEKYFLKP